MLAENLVLENGFFDSGDARNIIIPVFFAKIFKSQKSNLAEYTVASSDSRLDIFNNCWYAFSSIPMNPFALS